MVATPLAEGGDLLDGRVPRQLQLENGARLELEGARLLGEWVCGRLPQHGSACLEGRRVSAIEHWETRRKGPDDQASKGFAMVFFSPIIGLYALDDMQERREDEAELQERLTEAERIARRRAEARGVPAPPAPTQETLPLYESFEELATCLDIRQTKDRDATDGATLAGQVWRSRDQCLVSAAKWYLAAGDVARARRLTFVAHARKRFEAVACGDSDPGLDLPSKDLVATLPTGWVGEYRAVVADRATYAYEPRKHACRSGEPDRAKGIAAAVARFPLTDMTGV